MKNRIQIWLLYFVFGILVFLFLKNLGEDFIVNQLSSAIGGSKGAVFIAGLFTVSRQTKVE